MLGTYRPLSVKSGVFTDIFIKALDRISSQHDNVLIAGDLIMLNDSETHPHKDNWASSVKSLLSRLGFFEVWLAQGVGKSGGF